MQLGRAGYGNGPRLLCKQPGKCDLCRCRLLLCREFAKHIHQSLICSAVFFAKSRNKVAEIAFVKLRILIDLAGEEALAKRAKCNQSDSKLLKRRQYFLFRTSPPQR